ncbi:glucosaminyl deacetylase [Arthrobacter phage Lilmac1015]|uniref:Glucosaminyl deacetylase n=1 Tax=Arthrobacter phage Lilmac1015 TaxID=2912653 RepID=A0AA49GZI2_9CAUD|nr:glucosaminyl deacetylase [Arthrobacter phage Lilmac1015]
MKRRVLVLGAHPDDAELGAGGLLRESRRAAVWIACGLDDHRREEASSAAKVLRHDIFWGDVPDGDAEANLSRMIAQIEACVDVVGPSLVAIPPEGDTHQDHRAVRAAALSALRRSPISIVEYESPSAPPGWAPDFYVPISAAAVDAVEGALGLYASQSHAPYLEAGLYTARTRAAGVRVGATHAEPYKVVKIVSPA